MKRSHRPYDAVKRVADVVASTVGLVVLSPVLLLVALAVALDLGSPVLFRQRRPGLGGSPFTLYKFRTMRAMSRPAAVDVAPESATDSRTASSSDVDAVATDAARLTRVGRFLRASSLDELPELVNVLLGDMSIVGPRPLLMEYLPLYNETQARRHEVRPGITGWAQVNGRNDLSWDERFAADVWYVDHRSAALDLRIVLKTFGAVLGRKGVSAAGHATMEPFAPSAATAPQPRPAEKDTDEEDS